MKRWISVLAFIALAAFGSVGLAQWWLTRPLQLAQESVEVSIEPGTSPRDVAQAWVRSGVQTSPRLLYEWFRWSGESKKIRAGSYAIQRGASPVSLLDKMVRGDEVLANVRLMEGWTFRQFRAELARTENMKQSTATMSDEQVMSAVGAPDVHPEGRFFPDTYAFSKGASDLAVLKRAHAAMQRRLDAAWARRPADSPLKSPTDALIIASIVEKETGTPAERALVAAVFTNRLRLGMPLQTDPTVIYGMGDRFDGNLRKRDLQTDTPYNTYLRVGLPPTPIAMPGAASLLASMQPSPTKALYFVSRGDGTSEFSETLAAHNRAVDKYQRGK
jgi:UPF0755 protein